VIDEAASEALFCLRRLLRSDDDKTCSRAAEAILKFKMTLVRHRKAGKPQVLPDPRLEGLDDTDVEFVRYVLTLPEEQLAAWVKSLRSAPWPEYPPLPNPPSPLPRGGRGDGGGVRSGQPRPPRPEAAHHPDGRRVSVREASATGRKWQGEAPAAPGESSIRPARREPRPTETLIRPAA